MSHFQEIILSDAAFLGKQMSNELRRSVQERCGIDYFTETANSPTYNEFPLCVRKSTKNIPFFEVCCRKGTKFQKQHMAYLKKFRIGILLSTIMIIQQKSINLLFVRKWRSKTECRHSLLLDVEIKRGRSKTVSGPNLAEAGLHLEKTLWVFSCEEGNFNCWLSGNMEKLKDPLARC